MLVSLVVVISTDALYMYSLIDTLVGDKQTMTLRRKVAQKDVGRS